MKQDVTSKYNDCGIYSKWEIILGDFPFKCDEEKIKIIESKNVQGMGIKYDWNKALSFDSIDSPRDSTVGDLNFTSHGLKL
jgi:hypothetical protein